MQNFEELYNNEYFGHKSDKSEKFFGDKADKSEKFVSDKSEKFFGDKADKSEKFVSDKSEKGASDKSTNTALYDTKNKSFLRMVYLIHILVAGPLFILLGCGEYRNKTILSIVGYSVLLYHGFSLLKSEITGNWNWNLSNAFNFNLKKDNKNSKQLRIVYLLHILLVAPLLLYNSNKINKKSLGAVCILGVSALLYHGYAYWVSETTGKWNW